MAVAAAATLQAARVALAVVATELEVIQRERQLPARQIEAAAVVEQAVLKLQIPVGTVVLELLLLDIRMDTT